MDYFIIFLLLIVIFTFLSDQKVLTLNEIKQKDKDLNEKINKIYNDLLIVTISEEIKNDVSLFIETIKEKVKHSDKNYIIVKDKNVELGKDNIRLIIGNYINKKEKISGFMANYEYQYIENRKLKNILNELYNVGINYLNIFSKSSIKQHSVIVFKIYEVDEFNNRNKIITFSPCDELKVVPSKIGNEEILEKISIAYDSDFKAILKSILLVIVGISVTANLIYALFEFRFGEIVVAYIMYWCYNYVLKYMYSPIGKYKVLARYILPLFIIIYLILQIINSIKRKSISNKKVQAS